MDAVAAGTSAAVAWQANGELRFAVITASGNHLASPVLLSTTAGNERPSITTDGRGIFTVAWSDIRTGDAEIYLARVSSGGALALPATQITSSTGNSVHPSLVSTTGGFGLAWMDARHGVFEIYFIRLDAGAQALGSEQRITHHQNLSTSPSLAWTGSEFGLAWSDFRDPPGVYFQRLDAFGVALAPEQHIATAFPVCWGGRHLTWTGDFYGLVWEDLRDGDFDIFFTRLSAQGQRLDDELWVTSAALDSSCPQIAWSGSTFGITWMDERDGNEEIYFSRFACAGP